MKYFSTRDLKKNQPVSLKEAVLKGLADDGGLYMPEFLPKLSQEQISGLQQLELPEIATRLLHVLMGGEPDIRHLEAICRDVFNFPIPLVQLSDQLYSLELFHGPTLAFKDVGARFMARLTSLLMQESRKEVRVVVATSGDTGGAVASGFHGVEGIRVFILFPKGRVSMMQQKQLTCWGDNITAIEVDGSFDDCQHLVKQLLSEKADYPHFNLTSANSINIGRLLPQAVYYLYAWSRLGCKPGIGVSVPSGNFGNLTAGLLASAAGAGISAFAASTNINDVVPQYLKTGSFVARPSIQTISNAMDVGNPSNFERIMHLFAAQPMENRLHGFRFSDDETREAIRELSTQFNYSCDPHGAVAYLGLKDLLACLPSLSKGIFLETAHPSKFQEVVEACTGRAVYIPDRLAAFMKKKESFLVMENKLNKIRECILA